MTPDFRFDEVLKVYNYQNISLAAAKGAIAHFLCYELRYGTFHEPNQPKVDLTTLSEDEFYNTVKKGRTFGGVFQGYLNEGGKIF